MKAILEVLKLDVNDVITASAPACPLDASGSETCCEGDDNC